MENEVKISKALLQSAFELVLHPEAFNNDDETHEAWEARRTTLMKNEGISASGMRVCICWSVSAHSCGWSLSAHG